MALAGKGYYNQTSFIGGIMSDSASGDASTELYLKSVKTCDNFIPNIGGSVHYRQGLKHNTDGIIRIPSRFFPNTTDLLSEVSFVQRQIQSGVYSVFKISDNYYVVATSELYIGMAPYNPSAFFTWSEFIKRLPFALNNRGSDKVFMNGNSLYLADGKGLPGAVSLASEIRSRTTTTGFIRDNNLKGLYLPMPFGLPAAEGFPRTRLVFWRPEGSSTDTIYATLARLREGDLALEDLPEGVAGQSFLIEPGQGYLTQIRFRGRVANATIDRYRAVKYGDIRFLTKWYHFAAAEIRSYDGDTLSSERYNVVRQREISGVVGDDTSALKGFSTKIRNVLIGSVDIGVHPHFLVSRWSPEKGYPDKIIFDKGRIIYGNGNRNTSSDINGLKAFNKVSITRSEVGKYETRLDTNVTPASMEFLDFLDIEGIVRHIIIDRVWRVYTDQGVIVLLPGDTGSILSGGRRYAESDLIAHPDIKPLSVDGTDIVVDITGARVVEFSYSERDERYSSRPLYRFTFDLFSADDPIVAMRATKGEPKHIIFLTKSGKLKGLLFNKIEKISAWYDISVPEAFRITSLEESEDLGVDLRGTVDGSTVSATLDMSEGSSYLDFRIPTLNITTEQLEFLANFEPLIFMKGSEIYENVKVASGSLVQEDGSALPTKSGDAFVGVGYAAEIETLPLVRGLNLDGGYSGFGSARYWLKTINRLYANVRKARFLNMFLKIDSQEYPIEAGTRPINTDFENYTDDTGALKNISEDIEGLSGYDVSVGVRHSLPWPLRVLNLGMRFKRGND